jgi:hypothetical protein
VTSVAICWTWAEISLATAAIRPTRELTSSTAEPMHRKASRACSTTSVPSSLRRAPSSTIVTTRAVSPWISSMRPLIVAVERAQRAVDAADADRLAVAQDGGGVARWQDALVQVRLREGVLPRPHGARPILAGLHVDEGLEALLARAQVPVREVAAGLVRSGLAHVQGVRPVERVRVEAHVRADDPRGCGAGGRAPPGQLRECTDPDGEDGDHEDEELRAQRAQSEMRHAPSLRPLDAELKVRPSTPPVGYVPDAPGPVSCRPPRRRRRS